MEKHVRPATPADVDVLLELLLHVAEHHSSVRSEIFHTGRAAYTAEDLRRILATGEAQIFVSVSETDEVTGLILCKVKELTGHKIMRDVRTVWVEDMSVHPSERREGYGSMLLDHVKAYGREQGCARLELNVWAFNEGAHAFYLHEGMREQRHIMEFAL